MNKIVNVGMLGLGTVGENVFQIIKENRKYFQGKYGIDLNVKVIYVSNVAKKRNVNLKNVALCDNPQGLLLFSDVDLYIECMGGNGTEVTRDIVKTLLEKGKSVIMSSKKTIAKYGNELEEIARKTQAQIRCDAAVGGAVPIMNLLRNTSGYDKIGKIYGIVNATTNYVLHLMKEQKLSFEVAIQKAIEKGYAENDYSDDVDGWDAAYKMCILLKTAMGINISVEDLKVISIRSEEFKNQLNNCKQIFYAEDLGDGKVGCYVGPYKDDGHTFSFVKENDNVIFAEYQYAGKRVLAGKGAGGRETAAIMVEDLMDVLVRKREISCWQKYEIVNLELKDLKIVE